MTLYEKIKNREEKISLIVLEWGKLSINVAFAKETDVIGFDISK